MAKLADIELRPPIEIDWDELLDKVPLARGSFCDVFTATYQNMKVCVKVPHCSEESSKAATEHDFTAQKDIENERDMLQQLQARGTSRTVQLLGSGYYENTPFLVLEYLSGGTWFDKVSMANKPGVWWHKPGGLSFEQRLDNCLQLALAVEELHNCLGENHCMMHRDLKPQNIGFSHSGNLQLLDFGTAKIIERRRGLPQASVDFKMTGATKGQRQSTAGTLRYMAPEVYTKQMYDEKADVYSFGILCWQMLSQSRPYEGITKRTFKKMVVGEGLRPRCPGKWPIDLSNLLVSCWAEHPTARPTMARAVSVLQHLWLAEARRSTAFAHVICGLVSMCGDSGCLSDNDDLSEIICM
mmetsp:Transcript_11701/g.20886  ORF Transcript_11701/g.20886 Transcript_11701/m.20886 type:complete len:355 (-) Transcript_11701:268-1332(-)|eukprot:CAMPEP_0206366808 /NCGR_PEP_ID=MMETSP0294-20121207/3674_1 /ASSEMBLY_ACC=CAM_ASM_000327 /TAXON_ID=39354 /ORGANISM="Heterosigma akashiwo, Strain CCMP2393" /LENGTH=354 /DNA_ID=CAMNT_0053812947 /DNA_START=181 /DNA_END=1245 /DNA_ORIENTATION=-